MQKTNLPPAMYHGANSFAKENHRETTYAGFGCFDPFPGNRDASTNGGWHTHAVLQPAGLPTAAIQLRNKLQRDS
jgi:hypothetical protein